MDCKIDGETAETYLKTYQTRETPFCNVRRKETKELTTKTWGSGQKQVHLQDLPFFSLIAPSIVGHAILCPRFSCPFRRCGATKCLRWNETSPQRKGSILDEILRCAQDDKGRCAQDDKGRCAQDDKGRCAQDDKRRCAQDDKRLCAQTRQIWFDKPDWPPYLHNVGVAGRIRREARDALATQRCATSIIRDMHR
jgi:hypothetical protein